MLDDIFCGAGYVRGGVGGVVVADEDGGVGSCVVDVDIVVCLSEFV